MTPTDADREAAESEAFRLWPTARTKGFEMHCQNMRAAFQQGADFAIRHREASTAALTSEVASLKAELEMCAESALRYMDLYGQATVELARVEPLESEIQRLRAYHAAVESMVCVWKGTNNPSSFDEAAWETPAEQWEAFCEARAALSTTSEVSEPVADEAEMAAFGASEAAAIGCKASTEGFGSKERAIQAWNTRTSRLPDREEVARVLNEEFGIRPWEAVAADRRELKIWASSNKAYMHSEDTKEDFLAVADRILAMMEGRG